jgi:hypothetical protein
MKIRFFAVVLLLLSTVGAQAASEDDLRVHYYFLRGSLAGQNPFARSLDQFRTHFERLRADPLNTNVGIYQRTQELIQANPKTATSGESSQILQDLRTLSETGYEDSKVLKSFPLYSMATRYLTSGQMQAPRAYEALGRTPIRAGAQ